MCTYLPSVCALWANNNQFSVVVVVLGIWYWFPNKSFSVCKVRLLNCVPEIFPSFHQFGPTYLSSNNMTLIINEEACFSGLSPETVVKKQGIFIRSISKVCMLMHSWTCQIGIRQKGVASALFLKLLWCWLLNTNRCMSFCLTEQKYVCAAG